MSLRWRICRRLRLLHQDGTCALHSGQSCEFSQLVGRLIKEIKQFCIPLFVCLRMLQFHNSPIVACVIFNVHSCFSRKDSILSGVVCLAKARLVVFQQQRLVVQRSVVHLPVLLQLLWHLFCFVYRCHQVFFSNSFFIHQITILTSFTCGSH